MVNFKNINDITLDQNEYCRLAAKQHYTSPTFKIKIPKLMSKVPNSSVGDSFNRNIFVNAKECKPVVGSKLIIQDYITVPRSQQCSLYHKADKHGYISKNTGVICQCMSGNYKNMKIVDSM